MLFDYLVSSKARRALLRLLIIEQSEGSVSDLAARAGVSFSSAYEELKDMERAQLVVEEHQGRVVVFRGNRESPKFSLLQEFYRKDLEVPSHSRSEDEVTLLGNLARLGAPVPPRVDTYLLLSPEETLAGALKLARKNATVARILPQVLFKNWNDIDFEKLKALAVKIGEGKTLGFFMELTAVLSGQSHFKEKARELKDRRCKKSESFFSLTSEGKFAKRLEQRNTPAVAKKWLFRMNMPLESFSSHFWKFE